MGEVINAVKNGDEWPKYAFWHYYRNEENRPRWKCSECGKICKRLPNDKRFCSWCGAKMRMEA